MSVILSPALIAFACFMIATACPQTSFAQTYQVIHNFTGGTDGGSPPYTLAIDQAGHFYGTASFGGQDGSGLVFKLSKINSTWILNPLYDFNGQEGQPGFGLVRSPDGTIYTTAFYNSVMGGPCGTAIHLRPSPNAPASVLSPWTEDVMHTYVKREDGCNSGNLVLDAAGNVYGITTSGGANGWGSIVQFVHSQSGWTENILYSFQGQNDGGNPIAGLTIDSAGNLYGAAYARGANGWGTVFELSPSGSGWTYTTLYAFQNNGDGAYPAAGVVLDSAGNLYGATTEGGTGGGGTVFKLAPSGGSWTFSVLANLTGTDGPVAPLTLDSAGNVYGTTFMDDSYGYGSVFKLTPSGGGWTYTDLHDFTGGSDGGYPGGGVTLDSSGNLFGTAVLGGANGFGVVYEITP